MSVSNMNWFSMCALTVVLVVSNMIVTTPVFAATEHISSFSSRIEIQSDASLDITETIEYVPPYSKHGIYRYVPEQYPQPPFTLHLPLRRVKVLAGPDTDELEKHPFELSHENNNLLMKIGDPDLTFDEPRTYQISYQIGDAVRWISPTEASTSNGSSPKLQLVWDITGEGWSFPINQTQAVISSPETILEAKCYGGPIGSDDGLCRTALDDSKHLVTVSYDQPIDYNDNLTIDLLLEASGAVRPKVGAAAQLKWWQDNWWFLLTVLPLAVTASWWWRRGRDYVYLTEAIFPGEQKPFHLKPPLASRRVPFVYEPLRELTPGQAGAMLDERVDNQDVIAEILDLARHKYLKIEGVYKNEAARQKGKAKDYLFKLLKPADSKLPAHQRYLMDQLFPGEKIERSVNKSKGKFATAFQTTKKKIYDSLKEKGWYTNNPETARGLGVVLVVFLNAGAAFGSIMYSVNTATPWWAVIFAVQVVPSFLFAWNFPQKTALGSAMMGQARGLQKTIRYGKWREQIKEKHLFIDEVLPFAVAAGVITQLQHDLKDLNLPEPDYVSGFGAAQAGSWANSLSDFSTHTSSGLSYNPSSSSSGGSSGGSGGGGGGGGGGSW